MNTKEIILWILITLIVSATVIILVCGCAGGGVSYYDPDMDVESGTVSAPSCEPPPPNYAPQEVWIRHMGQPDQLVQVMPAY